MVPSFQDAFGDALATALEKLQPAPAGMYSTDCLEGGGVSCPRWCSTRGGDEYCSPDSCLGFQLQPKLPLMDWIPFPPI